MANSLLRNLETIGKDILKGIEVVAPIGLQIGAVVDPPLAPILLEVAQIVGTLEKSGATVDPTQLSQIIQAVTTLHQVKGLPQTAP